MSVIKSEVDGLRARVNHLEDHINRASTRARFLRFLRFMTKPIPLAVWLAGLFIGLYLLLINSFKLPQYGEILIGILAIIGVTLTLYQVIKPFKFRKRKK